MDQLGEGERNEQRGSALPAQQGPRARADLVPLARGEQQAGHGNQHAEHEEAAGPEHVQTGREPRQHTGRAHQRHPHEQVVLQPPAPAEARCQRPCRQLAQQLLRAQERREGLDIGRLGL